MSRARKRVLLAGLLLAGALPTLLVCLVAYQPGRLLTITNIGKRPMVMLTITTPSREETVGVLGPGETVRLRVPRGDFRETINLRWIEGRRAAQISTPRISAPLEGLDISLSADPPSTLVSPRVGAFTDFIDRVRDAVGLP